jgi:Sulfatase
LIVDKNRKYATECLHLFVLSQFALVQPLLYRLSRKTVFLEDQGIDFGTLSLLVGFLCVIVPGALWLLEAGMGLISDRARARTHQSILVVLFTLIAMPVLKLATFVPGSFVIALSLVAAFLASLAYRKCDWAKTAVSAAAPAILVFPAQFFCFSPVSRYLFPQHEQKKTQTNTVNNPAPIVLLLFDEFCGTSLMDRDGRIDAARYPNFASLAETATWYRNATSVHPRTEMAVPAILVGNYPSGPRPATIAEYPNNLFSILESTDQYEFIVFEPYTRLCSPRQAERRPVIHTRSEQVSELVRTLPPVYLMHLFPPDIPFEFPEVPLEWNAGRRKGSERPDSRTGVFRYNWNANRTRQFSEFLQRVEPSGQPGLYFAHLAIPHAPWCFLPTGEKYTPDDGRQPAFPGTAKDTETWGNDELSVLHAYQRYLLQLGYVDRLVGDLMERLHAADLFDKCLMIVMADHGVSFHAGRSRRLPVQETLADIASIPMFIKLPQQHAGVASDRNVESIDLLPTIFDLLDLNKRPAMDGVSLLDSTVAEKKQKCLLDDVRTFTLPAAFPSKQQTLTRMIELFGDGSEPNRLWSEIGPHRELIGQPVSELELGARSEVQVDLRRPILYPIAEDAPYLPCYFFGVVDGRDVGKQPIELAISINGIIRAVTRTYTDKKSNNMWAAMVPPTVLDPAADNVCRMFIITTNGDQVTLHPALDDTRIVQLAK